MSEDIFGETGVSTVVIPNPVTPQGIKDFLAQAGTFDIDAKSLAELEEKYSAEKIPANLSDKENYKLVQNVLAELRKSKKLIADQHRIYKAPVLEYGQRLDKIKREATPRVQALLDAWKNARDEYDAEQERIHQEKAQKEAERVGKIESRIDEIRNLPAEMIGETSEQIELVICELEGYSEDFQEFEEVGYGARKKTFEQLGKLLEQAELKEKQERIAAEQEEERKKKEAEDRAEFERQQKELAIKQEAANLTASVANFVLASSKDLQAEIDRIDQGYKDAPLELHEAAVNTITALKSLMSAAEQREAVERQQREQEAEQKRLEAEIRAEEERKAKAEAERRAEEERANQKKIDCELYNEAYNCARNNLSSLKKEDAMSIWKHAGTGNTITICLGEPGLLNKIDDFVNEQKIAFEASEKAREEAEARKVEDMGQTVADIMDCIYNEWGDGQSLSSVCEKLTDAIANGEISHVTWSNEK